MKIVVFELKNKAGGLRFLFGLYDKLELLLYIAVIHGVDERLRGCQVLFGQTQF